MNTLKFKTNIKCSGCVAQVSPILNEIAGEDSWKVDIENPEKTLTVSSDDVSAEEVIEALKEKGFMAESK